MKYKYKILGKEDTLEGNGLRSEIEDPFITVHEIDYSKAGTIDTEDLAGSKVPEMLQLVGSEKFGNLKKGEAIAVTKITTEVLVIKREK